jgi:glycosyltransferase involved in cell wall biosynthesis
VWSSEAKETVNYRMHVPISVCIITFNEEDNLAQCLSHLNFADEIIVVDSGSTDKTLEIAQNHNAKIFSRKFDNYINQKNYAISLAQNDWILALDADEVVSPALSQELELLNESEFQKYSAFGIPRLTYYLKRWIYHSGWYPNYQIRLFNRNRGHFAGILVHETVEIQGSSKKLKHPVFHYSYKSISDHLSFIDRYSTLFAIEKYKIGKRSGLGKAIVKANYKFFYMYFIRMGFLDGASGFVIAILGGYYNFLKYLKLYELEKDSKSISPLLVMVDPIHKVKSNESAQKDSDQVYI